MRKILIHVWTIPFDLLTFVAVLCVWVLWGKKLHWLNGLWCELKEKSWPARTWYKEWAGTCLGHGGFYAPGRSGGPGVDTPVEFHERVHSSQFEEACFFGFLVAALSLVVFQSRTGALFGAALWVTSPVIVYCTSLFHSVLHGKKAYSESMIEASAYTLTEKWEELRRGK